jgi:hypothetical protein
MNSTHYVSARRTETRQILIELAAGSLAVVCMLSGAVWAFRSHLALLAV